MQFFYRTLFIIYFLGINFAVQAQNLEAHLPAQAGFVISFDAQNYSTKGNFSKILETDFMKGVDENFRTQNPEKYETISQVYKNPKQAGINLFPRSYFFLLDLDSLLSFGFLFSIEEKSLWENWFRSTLTDSQVSAIENKAGYAVYADQSAVAAWSGSVGCILFSTNKSPDYYEDLDYSDPDYYEKLERRKEVYQKGIQEILKKQIEQLVLTPKAEGLTANNNFKNFLSQKYDLGFWVNYEKIINFYMQAFPMWGRGMPGMFGGNLSGYTQNGLSDIFKNYHDHVYVNFEAQEVKVNYASYPNDLFFEALDGVYNTRINPEFYKYIEGKNLMGLYAFSADNKKLFTGISKIYRAILTSEPRYGKIAGSVMDLLGIFIDEDAIIGILKGDIAVAVTDVKEMSIKYTDNVYDGDSYVGPVEKTKKEKIPLYVAMLTIGDATHMQAILQALENFELLKKKKGYYDMTPKSGGIPNFLAIENNILFISNDEELITKKLDKGYKRKQQIDDQLRNLTQQNAIFFFLDGQKIFQTILEESKKTLSDEQKKDLKDLKDNIKNLSVKGFRNEGKVFYTETSLQTNKPNANSLDVIVDLMGHFYKIWNLRSNRSYQEPYIEDGQIEKAEPEEETDDH